MQSLFDSLEKNMSDIYRYQNIKKIETQKKATRCHKLAVVMVIRDAYNEMGLTRDDFSDRELLSEEKKVMSRLTTFMEKVGIQKNQIPFSYIPMKDNRLYFLIEKLDNSLNALVTALKDALYRQEHRRGRDIYLCIFGSPEAFMNPVRPCYDKLIENSAVLGK